MTTAEERDKGDKAQSEYTDERWTIKLYTTPNVKTFPHRGLPASQLTTVRHSLTTNAPGYAVTPPNTAQ